MPKTPDDLLGAAEVSQILRADRVTVHRWAKSGRLPSQKLPGKTGAYLFRRGDVKDFARELKNASCSA